MPPFNRRNFLRRAGAASAVLTLSGTAPAFLHAAAQENKSDRILVVVELAGGNDGLNTIVPFADDNYRKLRPKLALPKSGVLEINDGLGFHPSLRGFADLLEAGRLAVVQGVGYDNPNRSHFESMDIWHTCLRKDEVRNDGWLGRFLDSSGRVVGGDPGGIHLGADKQPFALMSRTVRVPSIRTLDQFRLEGNSNEQFRMAVRELADARRGDENDLLNFVQSSTSSALTASERIDSAGKSYTPAEAYPQTQMGEKLQTIAKLINSGLQTAVYYVQLDGFDTHALQPDAHAGLLRQVGDAVSTFVKDLVAHGRGDQVMLMCFSEFGRRVAENASEGTDHGTAGPMFLAGTKVRPGLIGKHPKLSDLQDGDLKHHTDFRQVYATVLENWLGCDSRRILKGRYEPVDGIRI